MNLREIKACVTSAKNGSQEDLVKILEQFKPFVIKTAKTYNIRSFDMQDLWQIGYMTLMNAVTKYKKGSNTFSSYAYNAIKNSYKYTARTDGKYSRNLSLNVPLGECDIPSMDFIDCIEDPENFEVTLERCENIKEVKSAVTKLTKDESELVAMVYYSEIPLKRYAERKNIKYLQAIRKKNKILKKLACNLKN